MTRSGAVVLLLATSLSVQVLAPKRCWAPCIADSLWSGDFPMPLLLNDLIDNDLCPGSPCSDFDGFKHTTRKAINQWYLETGSLFQMTYEGNTSALPGTTIPGKVHVFASSVSPCTGGDLGVAGYVPSERTYGRIKMCIGNDDTPVIDWQTDSSSSGTKVSFQSVLMSELAHLVGMKHTQDCPGVPKSISSGAYQKDLSHLYKADIDFLQTYWGFRNTTDHVRTTTDGMTWVNGSTGPLEADWTLGRYTASNAFGGTKTFVTFIDQQYRTVYASKYDGSGWVMLASPPFASSNYHSGVASSSDTNVRIQFLGGYNASSGQNIVYEATSTNGGSTWGAPVTISDAGTESHTTMDGVNSTYDPVSAQYIRVWRGGYAGSSILHVHEVFYKVGTHPVQRLLDGSGNPYLSSDTPSVACGPTAVVGSENCLVAWTNGTSWYRTVKWFQASVNASGIFVPSTVKTHNYVSLATPSVSYRGDASFPWEISLNQGGYSTFNWRKAPLSSSSFQDGTSFIDLPKTIAPTMGSRSSGGTKYQISIVGHE